MKEIKICLDAGHYGKYNVSPCNKNYYESVVMWKLHLRLREYLEEYGFIVIQTRDNQNRDKSLSERGKFSRGCDLLLSLHTNATGSSMNNNIDYPVAIVPISGSADSLGKKLSDCVADTIGTIQPGKVISKKGTSGDYYGIIRSAVSVGTPGIILEHSFHTNSKVTNWLLNDRNLDKLAKAEADVLANYYGMKKCYDDRLTIDKAKDIDKSKSGTYKVNSKDGLKLRAGASTSKTILEDMPYGSTVKCYGYFTDKWYYVVSSKGNTGYCHSSYLTKL